MCKVLVIDDDSDLCMQAASALSASGYSVRTANTPSDGVDQVDRWRPALVILDLMMPRYADGLGVLRAIRARPGLSELPIVALSNYGSPEDVPWRFCEDATHHLAVSKSLDKPITSADLLAATREVLSHAPS
jgi:CheY-like chemotaxis protein